MEKIFGYGYEDLNGTRTTVHLGVNPISRIDNDEANEVAATCWRTLTTCVSLINFVLRQCFEFFFNLEEATATQYK